MARTRLNDWKTNPDGQRAVDFIQRLSLGGDFSGQPFNLMPWQEDIVRRLFGSVGKDGYREITDAFLFLPRGSGKTEFGAAICTYILFGEGKRKQGQELYSAASDKDQAARTFLAIAGMIRRDPYLSSLADVSDYHKRIRVSRLNNVYAALASEGFRRHSLAPSVVVADELHAWRGTELWDALTSGLSKRREPLTLVTTTSGGDFDGICYRYFEYARDVRDGKIVNPSYLPVIYQADPRADWTLEATWKSAMPALGTFSNLEVIRKQCELAKQIKSEEIKFKRYSLNLWLDETENWLDVARFDLCQCDSFPDLSEAETVGALDLSTTTDISAFCVCSKLDGLYYLRPYFWIPGDTAKTRERQEKLPYSEWVEKGWVELTDGDAVDYPYVARRIGEICEEHRIGRIAVDRYNSTHTAQILRTESGIEVFEHGQGTVSMDGPAKSLEWLILTKRIRHLGNPLMRNMVKSVCVKMDQHELIKPIKPRKQSTRVDGVIAACMCLGLLSAESADPSFFT